MNNLIKYIFLVFVLSFAISCEPIEKRLELGSAITADQLDITAVPLMVNGKRSNKVILDNKSPVLSLWNYGSGRSTRKSDTVLMVATGERTIRFVGLNPDGTKIQKNLTVRVDELTFPVPPEWAMLTGGSKRTWKWDETKPAVWGNGGYIGNFGPAWWTLKEGEMDEQEPGNGIGAKMELNLDDAIFTKIRSDGSKEVGVFSFDMNQKTKDGDGKIWGHGKFRTSGAAILVGKSPDEGGKAVYEFDIIVLNDKELVLAYAPPGTEAWGTAYFWVFRAID